MELSAVILAGGESKRMGRDKAWVELEGKPLLAHAVDKVRRLGVAELFISGRAGTDYSALTCPVLLDRIAGRGPLGGIERALGECRSPLLLVLAVDLPQMTTAFLERLVAHCDPVTGVVPERAGHLEPLAAIYPQRCHALAAEFLASSRHAVWAFAAACREQSGVRLWSVSGQDAECFANWNSPVDVPRNTIVESKPV
jgi:molybdenum cofactor guanylyltransferase